jgi:hypothetical protein
MSNVVQFARRTTSVEVIEKLIKLGYLKGTERQNARAIEHALATLQKDLRREQSIHDSDPPIIA